MRRAAAEPHEIAGLFECGRAVPVAFHERHRLGDELAVALGHGLAVGHVKVVLETHADIAAELESLLAEHPLLARYSDHLPGALGRQNLAHELEMFRRGGYSTR